MDRSVCRDEIQRQIEGMDSDECQAQLKMHLR